MEKSLILLQEKVSGAQNEDPIYGKVGKEERSMPPD